MDCQHVIISFMGVPVLLGNFGTCGMGFERRVWNAISETKKAYCFCHTRDFEAKKADSLLSEFSVVTTFCVFMWNTAGFEAKEFHSCISFCFYVMKLMLLLARCNRGR